MARRADLVEELPHERGLHFRELRLLGLRHPHALLTHLRATKSPFSGAVICTGARRIPATFGTTGGHSLPRAAPPSPPSPAPAPHGPD